MTDRKTEWDVNVNNIQKKIILIQNKCSKSISRKNYQDSQDFHQQQENTTNQEEDSDTCTKMYKLAHAWYNNRSCKIIH
jgi:hypothetical protein